MWLNAAQQLWNISVFWSQHLSMNLLKVFRGTDSMLPIFWLCKINPLCLICQNTLHSLLQQEWMRDGTQMLYKAFIAELRWNFWKLQLHWKKFRGKLKCNWLSTLSQGRKCISRIFCLSSITEKLGRFQSVKQYISERRDCMNRTEYTTQVGG